MEILKMTRTNSSSETGGHVRQQFAEYVGFGG